MHKSVFALCQVTVLTSVNSVRDLPSEVILDCVFTTIFGSSLWIRYKLVNNYTICSKCVASRLVFIKTE
jgi:hypothetical protein